MKKKIRLRKESYIDNYQDFSLALRFGVALNIVTFLITSSFLIHPELTPQMVLGSWGISVAGTILFWCWGKYSNIKEYYIKEDLK